MLQNYLEYNTTKMCRLQRIRVRTYKTCKFHYAPFSVY